MSCLPPNDVYSFAIKPAMHRISEESFTLYIAGILGEKHPGNFLHIPPENLLASRREFY
jgi:hypothetical protein